jgi:uncharacterized protein (TIGR03437 family)
LCLILSCSGWALDNLTQTLLGFGDVQVGLPTDLTVTMSPPTLNVGTVAFTRDNVPIAGCEAVPLSEVVGHAICHTTFSRNVSYVVEAKYSGATGWAASSDRKTILPRVLAPGVYIERTPALDKRALYGNNIILGALVLGPKGALPTGKMRFYVDMKEAGASTVVEDAGAEAATGMAGAHGQMDVLLPVGFHVAQAFYEGDDRYKSSWSPSMMFVVFAGEPKIAISATPAQVSQQVVVSASVTAAPEFVAPTGTITFDRLPGCENLAIDARGFAECPTTWSAFGDFPVTARYSGDGNWSAGSTTMWVKVTKANAGVFLAMAPERPVYGQKVTVSALILGSKGLSPPVGAMMFSDGGSLRGTSGFDGDGRASWTVEFPAGSRTVTASYSGDMFYAASQSSIPVTVAKAETRTTLEQGTGGLFTATVAVVAPGDGTPSGSVRFRRDGVAVAMVGLAGAAASYTTTAPGAITAEYLGDANFLASGSTTWSVAATAARVSVTSDRNPSLPGEAVTWSAAVTPSPGTAAVTGSVQFTADGAALGTVAVVNGRAAVTATLPAGPHTIVAAYSGNATYPAASESLTQVVTALQTGLGLSPSVASAVYGQAVTFTARVGAADATGTVKFTDDGVAIGSARLAGGSASLTVATLVAGAHRIGASWAGDSAYGGLSAEMAINVAKAPTTVVVTVGTGAATARVVAAAPGSGTPGGAARFVDMVSGTAIGGPTVVLAGLTGPVRAVYDGDDNFAPGASAAVNPVVVANAASYGAETVAPDEIVSVFGGITAGITTAKVTDSAGESREAQVLYSGPGQATLVLPAGMAKGSALVTAGWWTSAVTVEATAPGLFTADGSGKGAPAGWSDGIEAGTTVALYGTGIRNWSAKPVCTIGGEAVEVLYAGAQGEMAGLDQVNLYVPGSLKGIGATVLELVVDGVPANRVAVTVR